ncbi:MAG: arginine deiminase-related protein, partial [Chitinophagales bacterium]
MRQSTNNIMMVRPASFQYNEETAVSNDYQQKPSLSKEEVLAKAQEEFDQMVDLLEEKGVNVLVIEDTDSPEKPDAIFPNNWISMHGNGDVFLFPMA